jgi:hypothetical protein
MWLWEKLKDIGGACIGVAEMLGLKYPVTTYMSQVDATLWRSSRLPDAAAYDDLFHKGFNLIINLCAENDMDAIPADRAGILHRHVPIIDNTAPSIEQMLEFLTLVTDPLNSMCLVHCEAGKGRTGVAVACYRMAVCGWTCEDAIAEAVKFGLTLEDQISFLKRFAVDGCKQWRLAPHWQVGESEVCIHCTKKKITKKVWLLHYDDFDRGVEIFTSEESAWRAYKAAALNWECQLFVMIAATSEQFRTGGPGLGSGHA